MSATASEPAATPATADGDPARRGHDLRGLPGQRPARTHCGAWRRARNRQPADQRSNHRLRPRAWPRPRRSSPRSRPRATGLGCPSRRAGAGDAADAHEAAYAHEARALLVRALRQPRRSGLVAMILSMPLMGGARHGARTASIRSPPGPCASSHPPLHALCPGLYAIDPDALRYALLAADASSSWCGRASSFYLRAWAALQAPQRPT